MKVTSRWVVLCISCVLFAGSWGFAVHDEDQQAEQPPDDQAVAALNQIDLLSALSAQPSVAPAAVDVPGDSVCLRVRVGLKDADPTDWSGSAEVAPGRISEVRGWRWAFGDHAKGTAWEVHTRPMAAQNDQQRKLVQEGKRLPLHDNGVILRLDGVQPDSKVTITLKQGAIKFSLADVPLGKSLMQLDGAVEIERTPVVGAMANTAADEDYPAMATGKDGSIHVAYLSFTRGKSFPGHRERMQTPTTPAQTTVLSVGEIRTIAKPEDLDYLAEKTGGEQLYLRSFRNGKWSDPAAVTDGANELYRPAVAVDGSGRVWVFYSAQLNADSDLDHGNWELLARSQGPDGKWGDVVNVSHADGPDFLPAAATDSQGQVWVTWMGGRDNGFHVYAAHQQEQGFTQPIRVSAFAANEWDPSIAADAQGRLAIAWDTYEKGDYDVYLATRQPDGSFGPPQAVAATNNFEARSSLAYDRQGQLWIAWEQSGDLWGKDFGALKKLGIPLYQGRSLGVKILKPDGQWAKPAGDVNECLPRFSGQARQRAKAGGQAAQMRTQAAPCFPKIAVDDEGRVWLAFRGRHPGQQWRVPVGSVWYEYVTHYDGKEWAPASWLPQSNNVLDNRPSLVTGANHEMLLAFSGDGRGEINPVTNLADPNAPAPDPSKPLDVPPELRAIANQAASEATAAGDGTGKGGKGGKGNGGNRPGRRGNAVAGPDPNQNIFFVRLHADGAAAAPELESIAAEKPAEPLPIIAAERDAIKTIRAYRTKLGNDELRIWRGEFHRHTELSPDGGGDGALLDMWRYTHDAVALDWVGDGDHDFGNGREYSWWTTQKAVTLFTLPGRFVPMFSYERSVNYPEGHRNVIFAKRGIRSLPRLPLSDPNVFAPAPDTELLYQYLHHFNGVCAEHTSATTMGTDWRNNDPEVEPWVEIYQGDRNNYERPDAPRSAVREAANKKSTPEAESFGGYRPKGFVNLALLKGYRLAFEASSDHISTHLSFANVYVTDPTRENILQAIKKRRVYGATDNIIADVRCTVDGKDHFMGEEFSTTSPPAIHAKIIAPRKLTEVVIVKDDQVVYTAHPDKAEVDFTWTDPNPTVGKTSYYYVRGQETTNLEGAEGEIVWASPMWIKYER